MIPHVLGSEPRQSIVVLALRDNKIGLTSAWSYLNRDRVEEVAEPSLVMRSGV